MLKQQHAMIDIETMSTNVDAAVVAIGARLFTIEHGPGKGFEMFIDKVAAARIGHVDTETMRWWSKQQVRDQVMGGMQAPETVAHALSVWLKAHGVRYLWANPPQFDVVILRHMFEQVKIEFPLGFRAERDFRTIKAIGDDLGLKLGHHYNGAQKHLPGDDATVQAKVIVDVLQYLYGISTQAVDSSLGSAPSPVVPARPVLTLKKKPLSPAR